MSTRGVVSTLCDPGNGALIGDDWCKSIAGLGADSIKVPLLCAADGSLPTALYQAGMDVANRHALPVLGLFTRGFVPAGGETATLYPNMPLDTAPGTNTLLSPYIDAATLRIEGFVAQMVKHGLVSYIAMNEPNLLGLIAQGTNPTGAKGSALNPEVAAALAWQTAHRAKAGGAKQVYAGSLSVLPQTGLDGKNPYYALWLDQFYGFLANEGVRPPYPFDGWWLNAEGIWPAGQFAKAVGVLRHVMDKWGDQGTIGVAEWGVTNAALPARAADLQQTYGQIAAATGNAYLFQHFGATPYLGDPATYGGWGCVQWRILNNVFVPLADYKLAPVARTLFAVP